MSGKRVFVAMSGGVDSSVVALLLKEQGYDVTGITMQIWPQEEDDSKACCSLSAVNDARRVAWHLDIPHYVMNFRDEFEAKVIRYFCDEYQQGRTPNPCIACNKYIKFDSLLDKALAMGADLIATGHYARVIPGSDGEYSLVKGLDPGKDQSYVLYNLTQRQLSHTMFPLGEYNKSMTREMAREARLPVADKPESQEICFVPSGKYSEFVEQYVGQVDRSGEFRSTGGQKISSHGGIHRYTIGQRKGLGVALGHPVYVTGIDPATRTVFLGENEDLFKRVLIARDVNYISGHPFTEPMPVTAKIRYAAPAASAVATSLADGSLKVEFEQAQRAITPGQAVVVYDGDRVLGGGTIVQVLD
ncbi:MAG: tRNA 2-thiouridine(34) synthase MnmA [Candidatus Saccharibacteria bacterium]